MKYCLYGNFPHGPLATKERLAYLYEGSEQTAPFVALDHGGKVGNYTHSLRSTTAVHYYLLSRGVPQDHCQHVLGLSHGPSGHE